MPRYIDADELLDTFSCYPGEIDREIYEMINSTPIMNIQPQQAMHGVWKTHYLGYGASRYECSVCDKPIGKSTLEFGALYCPNCGAKMDGGIAK